MPATLTDKQIDSHRIDGSTAPGQTVAVAIDQTLTQDATGTLAMLELEAMGIDRVETELSAQYVDHNLLQTDEKNADDHLFLESACQRFGVWFSRPGNGVSHPVHMQRFGKPGKTLIGSDSHTPAAGSLGMLAFGAGGLDVAMAMAGHPYYVTRPAVFGVRLFGELPHWVSAKDVVLEMLGRHGVDGARGMVIEYYGPGLESLSAMDRHVIANMGTELGATSTVFPSDDAVRDFLDAEGRADDWQPLEADEGAEYAYTDEIDLSGLVPLIALPSSPGNVVPVSEIEGEPIYQAYIGSSANPGYRDFAVPARMVEDRSIPTTVSFDINPTSRQLLNALIDDGSLATLIAAGARIHQAGCNGCIGMGQAPATGRNSLRTTPRNFPGRSGAKEDAVFLCSPETATASALRGRVTDPRRMEMNYPRPAGPDSRKPFTELLEAPPTAERAKRVEIVKSDNISSMPIFDPLPDEVSLPVLLKVGDHISTDEILPAGTRALPYRSNIPKISDFAFADQDPDYVDRAREITDNGDPGHIIVGGRNYGQGSSREHAVVATRYLGLRIVIAKSFARIHYENLMNFGVLPLTFATEEDFEKLEQGATLSFSGLQSALADGDTRIEAEADGETFTFECDLEPRHREVLQAGGLINKVRD
jgi:aconitate hydratase